MLMFLWLVWMSFISQKGILNLWPVWIGSHCDEEIRLVEITTDGHGVLEELEHVPAASRMRGWEDDVLANLAQIKVLVIIHTLMECITQALIKK